MAPHLGPFTQPCGRGPDAGIRLTVLQDPAGNSNKGCNVPHSIKAATMFGPIASHLFSTEQNFKTT